MQDGMLYEGQGASEVPKIALFNIYVLHHLSISPAPD